MSITRKRVAAALAALTGLSSLGLATTPSFAADTDIVINEIESQAGQPDDWAELYNRGTATIDISGWVITDNAPTDATHRYTIPAGTTVAPGAFYTLDLGGNVFGLGGADSVILHAADGTTIVDQYSWTAHSATSLARCPNGTGEFVDSATPTKNAPNDCVKPSLPQVIISEVNPNGTDFIELFNAGTTDVDVSGYVIMDDQARDSKIKAGTILKPGEYLALMTDIDFTFGLGKADAARIFLPDGTTLVDSYSYTAAPVNAWSRCDKSFVDMPATPGYANDCGQGSTPPPSDANPWPGSADVTVIDKTAMFLQDSSGLDFTMEGDQGVLWAMDNDNGTFFKLNVQPDGSAAFAPGWEQGKRISFIKDAGNPAVAGPDTEGVTIAADGVLYVGVERDNADKSINKNMILKVDPKAAGPMVTATQEWDLTASLPQVTANTGIEAVEYVSDADLAGKLWDANTKAPYDPAKYPGHGDGLFFVAVEDNGGVYAYALNADGTAKQISFLIPGLGGVMSLDWDTVEGGLWAKCDNGCANQAAFITFNGTDMADVAIVDPPAGLPADMNHEGFATSSIEFCINDQRPVWWFADGEQPGALRSGMIDCSSPAWVDVTPRSWLDGDTVTITAGGYTAGEKVVIRSTDPDGKTVDVATVTANDKGEISWSGSLPVTSIGKYTITLAASFEQSFTYTRGDQSSTPEPGKDNGSKDQGSKDNGSKDQGSKDQKPGADKGKKPSGVPATGVAR